MADILPPEGSGLCVVGCAICVIMNKKGKERKGKWSELDILFI
jgi:hypothetical protein